MSQKIILVMALLLSTACAHRGQLTEAEKDQKQMHEIIHSKGGTGFTKPLCRGIECCVDYPDFYREQCNPQNVTSAIEGYQNLIAQP